MCLKHWFFKWNFRLNFNCMLTLMLLPSFVFQFSGSVCWTAECSRSGFAFQGLPLEVACGTLIPAWAPQWGHGVSPSLGWQNQPQSWALGRVLNLHLSWSLGSASSFFCAAPWGGFHTEQRLALCAISSLWSFFQQERMLTQLVQEVFFASDQ